MTNDKKGLCGDSSYLFFVHTKGDEKTWAKET